MSWIAVLVLAGGAYLCKVTGLVLVGGRRLPARVQDCLALIPAALLAALLVTNTLDGGQEIVVDARAAGVAAAVLATWRRAPFPVVILMGAATTAIVRGLGA